MFKRVFIFAVFAIVASSFAAPKDPVFKAMDFIEAHLIQKNGGNLVSAHLSPSGLQKVKAINETLVGQEVGIDVAGVKTHFTVREKIKGEEIEIGPYTAADGEKIVRTINRK